MASYSEVPPSEFRSRSVLLSAEGLRVKSLEQGHFVVERVQRGRVLDIAAAQQRLEKLLDRGGLFTHILERRTAGVDQHRNRKGCVRLPLEHGDVLLDAAIEHREIALLQRPDQIALARPSRSPAAEPASRRPCRAVADVSARPTAGPSRWRSTRRSSPSASYAGFHDGIVPFAVDPHFAVGEIFFLPHRHQPLQAVDAFERRVERGLRCGAVTTTATLVSPISMRPSRCTMAMRPMAKPARDLAPDLGHDLDRHGS